MKDAWFTRLKGAGEVKLRLFCFPYAGGNSVSYKKWQTSLPKDVELVLIQPPGRATRMFDQPFDDMDALTADIFEPITALLDKP